jgi:hypothetical protein
MEEKMRIQNAEHKLRIESEAAFHQLVKNIQTEKTHEQTSVCYLLKEQEYGEDVYKIASKYLDDCLPDYCKVEEHRKVAIECFYNGHWGFWKFSPILGEVADKSGFAQVEKWLDNWSETKDDFEYNKKYFLWLLKVTYPASKGQAEYFS